MRFVITSILCFFSLIVSAQTIIDGGVYDFETKQPIEFTVVYLHKATDPLQKKRNYGEGVFCNKKGEFSLKATAGNYILETSMIGYLKQYQQVKISTSPKLHLDSIFLHPDSIQLSTVTVFEAPPPMIVKGDTIEFNASSYQPQEGEVLEDLIRKIAGIEIDSYGNISANGKPISKIMLNGKTFFGNNVSLALKNLPATMISKLQLFREKSEKEKLTGFRDGDGEQVLNLKVKKEIKKSIFGNAKVGYGSSNRYGINANANYIRDDAQVSAIIDMGNTAATMGSEDNKNEGVNFDIQASKKFKIGGDLQNRRTVATSQSMNSTETFLDTGNRNAETNSESRNTQKGVENNLNMEWTPDSLTTISLKTSIKHQTQTMASQSTSLSYVPNDTTSNWVNNDNSATNNTLSGNLTMGRVLSNNGRRLVVNFTAYSYANTMDGENHSQTNYSLNKDIKVLDQILTSKSKLANWNTSISYIEPLNKTALLMLEYSYGEEYSTSDSKTFRPDAAGQYTVLDTAYSRKTVNKYTNQNLNISFRSNKEKYNYEIGLNLLPSTSVSHVSVADSSIDQIKQHVLNYSPTLSFSYSPNNWTNFDMNYRGMSGQASLRQLSADTLILNSMSKTYGNPSLKRSFVHSFSTFYQKTNWAKRTSLTFSTNFNYTTNGIVNYTLVDSVGNSERTYRNVTGNMNASAGFTYRFPFKKVTLGTNTNFDFLKDKGFTNTNLTTTNSYALSENVNIIYSYKNIDLFSEMAIVHTITKNDYSSTTNMAVTNYSLKANLKYKFPLDFSLTNDIAYHLNTGYSDNFGNKGLLWNIHLEKRFLKNKMGLLSLFFYNILDSKNNVRRRASSEGISYSWSNSVGPYAMLRFVYRFHAFKGPQKEKSFGNQ